MALTRQASRLSEDHRQLQAQIRRRFLQQIGAVAPAWQTATPDSFDLFMEAAVPIAAQHHQLSGTGTARYYNSYRAADRVLGDAPDLSASPFNRDRFVASAYIMRDTVARRAGEAGFPAERIRNETMSALTGSMSRHVLNGGRSTLEDAIRQDGQAVGWERMTGDDPCAFCAMLASRGAVYTSQEAAERVGYGADPSGKNYPGKHGRIRGTRQRDDSFHDNCQCYAEARFLGDPLLSERNRPYREMWDASTRETNQPLKEFRRVYEGRAEVGDVSRVDRALGPRPTRRQVADSVSDVRTISPSDVPRYVDRQVDWAQSVGWEVDVEGRLITGVRNANRPGAAIQWELTDRGTWRVLQTA